jgi:putative transposase
VVFISATHVKVLQGQVMNRPTYAAIGITTGGEHDILGTWTGDGGGGAKFWLAILAKVGTAG